MFQHPIEPSYYSFNQNCTVPTFEIEKQLCQKVSKKETQLCQNAVRTHNNPIRGRQSLRIP